MSEKISKRSIAIGFGILFFVVFIVIMLIILKPDEKKKNNNNNNAFRKGGNNQEESDSDPDPDPKPNTDPKSESDEEVNIKPALKIKIQLDTQKEAETPAPISIYDVDRNKLIHYISQNGLDNAKFKDEDTQYEARSSEGVNELPKKIKIRMTGTDKVCFRKIKIDNKFYTKRVNNIIQDPSATIGCMDGSGRDSNEYLILFKYDG